jgi:uncharacterized protein
MTADDINLLGKRLFEAIETADIDALRDIYAPDVAIWHNFDQAEQGRDDNLRLLGWLSSHVTELRYTEIRRVVIDDGFVQQHVLRGTAPNGTALEVPAMLRVFCKDGRVTRIEEYLDTAQVAALR